MTKFDLNAIPVISVLMVNLNRCLASSEILLIIIPILIGLLRFIGFLQVQDRFVGKIFITVIPVVLRIPLIDLLDDYGGGEDNEDDDYDDDDYHHLLQGDVVDHCDDRSGNYCCCCDDGFTSNTCPMEYVLGNIWMSIIHQGVYCYETIQMK